MKRKQMTFPIQVSGINFSPDPSIKEAIDRQTGMLVAIRPCDEERTYLGIYIGDVALNKHVQYDLNTQELQIGLIRYNPAFFVPELTSEFMLYVINAGGKASTRGMPIPRCPHCDYLTSGVNYIPEVMYYGKTVR